uniref:DRBM domain-containing protein n=1 Tax=Globisporangium ultimum (strain ATCC 200006 / CBS 805.95 / DAOM BR144) TaxID=431595 RepID=K3WYJ9_GLOUD
MANSHADAQTLRGLRAPTNNSSRENDAAQESGSVRRIVLLSTTARDASSQEPNNESTATVFLPSSDISTDPTLPAGWQKIIHDSRLPCYVHETLRLVCWTKPYVLDVMGSSSEFVKVAQQHVPPLSLFKTPADVKSANEAKDNAASAGDCRTERHDKQLPKKRKLKNNSTEQERQQKTQEALAKGQDTQLLSMSIDEFKTLPIGDPRVLQACMELSVKTPAQVLQEYQNRNRGISINYNTIPIERDGVKLFKTIVTAGSSAAEGIATTKKVAKQLGAQSLLAMLHERTAKTYQEVADLYNSVAKSQTTAIESSSSSALVVTAPLQHRAIGVPLTHARTASRQVQA